MPKRISPKTGSELFIVDNSIDDWKVVRYLRDWCDLSNAFDIATGTFEIGSLLALDGEWQKVDIIRILMGDEVSLRTKKLFVECFNSALSKLDSSIEKQKDENPFLKGVPAIVEALKTGKIRCRVYRKEKFHAKAYITHARKEVIGAAAIVGSSNFTYPGLNENVELNVQITGGQVAVLQEWFEEYWNQAEDVTPEILRAIERHTREYLPFEVYAKAMQEFFKGHEMTAGEWELAGSKQGGSRMYSILDHYQKEGYHALMKIAAQYGGAFLCDGVGLGKTFVGLMIIERFIRDRKRVALFVPKAARVDVWERDLRRYLPYLSGQDYSNLAIFSHTDLLRKGDYPERLQKIKEVADVIVIDEAHHFRNPGLKGKEGEVKSRYWQLSDIVAGKTVFMLTATPINNRLLDLQHMIELFTQRKADYFKDTRLGIHSLPGHFRKLENVLEKNIEDKGGKIEGEVNVQVNQVEAEEILWSDELFRELVVQRSRAYVKKSQEQHAVGSKPIFPQRQKPKVVPYDLKKTYGGLLKKVEDAFQKEKPLFSLAVYYPMAYYKGPDIEKQKKAFLENRQRQVVSLIRIQFLKRFESSGRAFEFSCENLLIKLLAWVTKHSETEADKKRFDRWKRQHVQLINEVHQDQHELLGEDMEDLEEDVIDEETLEAVEKLSRDEYKIDEILDETYLDLDQIVSFLGELKRFKSSNDDKLRELIDLLRQDPVLRKHKVLIFSEYMATARYLKKGLENAGFTDVDEIDSATGRDRSEIIRKFSPYYNRPVQGDLFEGIEKEIRILISTDVLSEGLNLQDATRLINYDIHWNPVRLMQRIGRVDRRLNPEIEKMLITNHPEQKDIRGTVAYWNFLPPEELDELLRLYAKVSKKTLRISKVFGIEGRKLLTPEDDYEALKDFNHTYEGTTTAKEEMHLEYQKLLRDYPDLEARLVNLPGCVFSGKQHPKEGSRGVFFCYALPAPGVQGKAVEGIHNTQEWTEEAGFAKWYLYDLTTDKILEEPSEIIGFIRSTPETPRHRSIEENTLSGIRAEIEKHIKNSYFKQVQAPIGVKAILKAWMELS